jgi:hypothetical protein
MNYWTYILQKLLQDYTSSLKTRSPKAAPKGTSLKRKIAEMNIVETEIIAIKIAEFPSKIYISNLHFGDLHFDYVTFGGEDSHRQIVQTLKLIRFAQFGFF